MIQDNNIKIAIIGLGYVGLPLAVEFAKLFPTIGYDLNQDRVAELKAGSDRTLEVSDEELAAATHLECTSNAEAIKTCNVFIVTVPTPVTEAKLPDLTAVRSASHSVATALSRGDIVIYESTVYPGVTEDICVPILAEQSGLEFNTEFFVGYSPERINPGDKEHRVTDIKKVTAGSTPEAADFIDDLYGKIIRVGTFKAASIRVAEAAKVIENTQRDVNIALINELAMLFNKLGINTTEVLEAAGTKWNFLPFRPGLVGGHCIGVDPYYLTHKAQEVGFDPKIILSGREINDGMGEYIIGQLAGLMVEKGITISGANVLIMGFTFKENCPDVRNTRVIDMVDALKRQHANVDIYDPWAEPHELEQEYSIPMIPVLVDATYDAIIVAVAHQEFIEMGYEKLRALGKENCVVYDIKSVLPASKTDASL